MAPREARECLRVELGRWVEIRRRGSRVEIWTTGRRPRQLAAGVTIRTTTCACLRRHAKG